MTGRDRAVEAVEAALTLLVRRATSPRVQQRFAELAGVTLERALYVTLARIGGAEPVRLTDLADELDVDVSTSSRQVRALEDQGLVARACGEDRRVSLLTLTADGREVLERARRARQAMICSLLGGWADHEVDTFAALLERFAATLGQHTPAGDDAPTARRRYR